MKSILKRLFKRDLKYKSGENTDKTLKILLYGDIDMNLIDGSSIWLNSMAQVLAIEKSFHITILLKARIILDRLLIDLKEIENIKIINTYDQYNNHHFENKNRLIVPEALQIISELDDESKFDCILLRGYELCEQAVTVIKEPERIIPYITNYTHDPDKITSEEIKQLRSIFNPARVVFAQTNEMKDMLNNLLGYKDGKICILTPMIHNLPKKRPSFKNFNNTLVYTGKFSNDYMLYETLKAFEEINEGVYKYNIAGDKFHFDLIVPKKELIKMMEEMPNVHWSKGLPRHEVSELIESSDLGLCWRSTRIDNENSLELSTKVLEYGRLGKPVLIRKTPIHARLLGKDYPFYVDTTEELIEKIKLAFSNEALYKKAAKRMYQVSRYYTFNNAIERIRPCFLKFNYKS